MGFSVAEGPEIETEWYNFDALNIPSNHPARDLWDTFWLKPKAADYLLRTHTSPLQVRYMEKNNPPLRIIAPGRIFRYEATDATHEINFYQLEGLMIGKDVSVANFKAIIEEFYSQFFQKKTTVRLRPSYFPFTEPSFEIDMKQGKGDWLEMMGAGMVHPNVLKAVGYIPGEWQGFAFGMGLDRLAMMKYKIDDVRLLYSGDLRFLKQF
jgi:phenylalanyl-tRNA synthetase alpha chain